MSTTLVPEVLADSRSHEVMKNDPPHAAIGARARDVQWRELERFWLLAYTLR